MSATTASPSQDPRPPDAARHSIPVELTSFVGRERELGEIRRLLPDARLLTLTGAGGSGKSRLALEVAAPAAASLGADLVWVELAALSDPELVLRHVADVCGLREEIRGSDAAPLVELLRDRLLLLVLDNCEHVVDACAELADRLLRGCPGVRILATSREALGVPGERAWLVPALTLPAEESGGSAALAGSEAVRLFRERARDVVSTWELDEATTPVVVDICRRLDGIPLAIELAAARVKVLPVEQIRDRLDDAFRLLSYGGRTGIPRHRTLRAAMDWSHDLLRADGRVLLRRLSVFRGDFSLDAVEAVGADASLPPEDVLDVLSLLVDRSLVAVREHRGEGRYGLLETVRQYSARRLFEAGEEDAVRRRHAAFVAGVVAEAEPHLIRAERPVWVARLELDLDNVREALAWSLEHDRGLHVRLVGRLWWFWFSTRHWSEAARWIGEALALPEAAEPGLDRARLLFAAGALGALRAQGADARSYLEEAAELAGSLGDGRLEAYAVNYLGMTRAGEGDGRGRALCARAAAWFETHGDLYGLRLALLLMGSAALADGDGAEAERLNREGVDVARRFGLDRELAVSLQNLAVVYLERGEVDRAAPLLWEALAACRRDPSHYFMATGLQYAAEVLGHGGRPLEAARILGAVEAVREAIGAPAFGPDRARLEAALPGFREAAGEEAFERARAEGRRMRPEEAVDRLLDEAVATAESDAAPPAPPAPALPAEPRSPAAVTDAGASPELRVRLLGPFEVEVEGRPAPAAAWPYVKPRELLAHLLLHPEGRTRDRIAEALWPGAAPAQLKNSFHVTVHHLRKALGHPEWIERDGDRYRLAPGVRREVDVFRFESEARVALGRGGAGADGAAARALALYRGDLLEDEAVGPWRDEHRDRLWRLYVDVALVRGLELEREGRWDEAGALYGALAAREDLDEEIHRRLMRCWSRGGRRAQALRHYERLGGLLREALGAEPEPETVELFERIRSGEEGRSGEAGATRAGTGAGVG